ncbi:MAG: aldo/keto reductase [Actinobacteria bacterium]|nr:aldo/keto reductase [Actinomycetota bacterium]
MVLGRTGLEVCRLGLGGIPLQRVSEAQAVETVRHAVEQGVDFIDTSRAYSTSERRIGLALAQTDKRVVVASKAQAKTAEKAWADLHTSLAELQRDYIDIYKCHFVADEAIYQKVISSGGAYEAYQRAKNEKLIGHIGITSHNLDVLDRALDDDLFDVIMVCFSFLEPKAREEIIPKALEKNVGVIAMKPFSGGVIEEATLALKFALSEPGILVIPGVGRSDLFDQNWKVFLDAEPLTDSESARIAELRNSFDKVFCRRCDYCQPCSEDISIQTILGIRSSVKRMGRSQLEESFLWKAVEKARNCSRCGDCMTRCPYGLPIPDLIEESLAWLDEDE